MVRTRNGVVRHSSEIKDLPGTRPRLEGWYIMFGSWKGPFTSPDLARSKFRVWRQESMNHRQSNRVRH